MTAALGFGTVAVFLALTFSRRVSVPVALVVVPTVAALFGGFANDLEVLTEGLAAGRAGRHPDHVRGLLLHV